MRGRWSRRVAAGSAAALIAAPAAAEPPLVPPPAPAPAAFGDWHLACAAAGCRIETELRAAPPRSGPLLRLSVEAADARTLLVRTPLPLFLPDGLRITPRETEPVAVPWITCGAVSCEARVPLDPAFLAALRKQPAAHLELTLRDGARARLPVSLIGFTAAYRALGSDAGAISP